MIRVILLCLLFAFSTGCAAIGARENKGAGVVFAGVRNDVYYLIHPSQADYPFLQPLNLLDMPFSFAIDTICLPYDLLKLK